MGNKAGKCKSGSCKVAPDSDEFWWIEVEKTLSPIETCEEFCQRFCTTPDKYNESVQMFHDVIEMGSPEDSAKPYMTRETWLKAIAIEQEGPNAREWGEAIWNCFDTDKNNQLSMNEWLVYDGLRKFGSLEQRVMGSFVLFDPNNDRKIQRDEIEKMMRVARDLSGVKMDEEMFASCLETLIKIFDTDHNGTLELSEAIKAARENPTIAKIFNSCKSWTKNWF